MDNWSVVVDEVKVSFDLEALKGKLRLRSAKTEKMLEELAAKAETIARPKAAAKLSALTFIDETRVQLDDIAFSSSLLRQNLDGLGRGFPYLATEGEELAAWGRGFSGMERIFTNALQTAAMRQAQALLEEQILRTFGLPQISAMNPGSLLVWPITQQEPLFKLLDPLPRRLGITLLPTYMMKPEQTVSGIFFQTDSKFHNCQLCPRLDCPNRRAPYSGM